MIPWIESQVFWLGPIPVRTWGTFVAAGFLVGGLVAARRAKKKGLKPETVWDLAFWFFLAAFLGARLFHVLFYDPGYYLQHPWQIIDPRAPGFAIYGGFLGCAATFWYFVKKRGLEWIHYADVLIWGLPIGCGIGRIGCFLIHDHPGTLSNSLLSVRYPDGQSRHDLGLYLSFVGFSIAFVFLLLDRRPRKPGFWIGLYVFLDSLSRLVLDFFRVADVRYLGLTPTQILCIPLAGFGLWLLMGMPRGKVREGVSA